MLQGAMVKPAFTFGFVGRGSGTPEQVDKYAGQGMHTCQMPADGKEREALCVLAMLQEK